jgi:hypothetical protein
MNEYNFNVLTWGEFEEFTKDLLSEEMGVSFQAFADGADGGIDLRYSACDNDRTIIVQCKRYKSASGLMANLAKERLKLDEMSPAPERYILSVSLDLTEDKINDIVALFSVRSSDTERMYLSGAGLISSSFRRSLAKFAIRPDALL